MNATRAQPRGAGRMHVSIDGTPQDRDSFRFLYSNCAKPILFGGARYVGRYWISAAEVPPLPPCCWALAQRSFATQLRRWPMSIRSPWFCGPSRRTPRLAQCQGWQAMLVMLLVAFIQQKGTKWPDSFQPQVLRNAFAEWQTYRNSKSDFPKCFK